MLLQVDGAQLELAFGLNDHPHFSARITGGDISGPTADPSRWSTATDRLDLGPGGNRQRQAITESFEFDFCQHQLELPYRSKIGRRCGAAENPLKADAPRSVRQLTGPQNQVSNKPGRFTRAGSGFVVTIFFATSRQMHSREVGARQRCSSRTGRDKAHGSVVGRIEAGPSRARFVWVAAKG